VAEAYHRARRHATRGYGPTNFVSYDILRSKSIKENAMQYERIEINPDIMDGKPVIRGTRVPVELVLRKLGAGLSPEAILGDHPRLTLVDIHAAQAFAAG
jgi:uncharacterized protein (DUF433 family)